MKKFKEYVDEMAGAGGVAAAGPTNVTGSGAVAGMGQPPGSKSGEPGVDLRKRRKHNPIMMAMAKRKAPK
jgi:hypothetical protein